jgi:hypothetical protein
VLHAETPEQDQHSNQQQPELESNAAEIAAHRTAELTVLLPPGITDLKMQLRRPAFIFGTAIQPETAPDQEWYENTTAAMFWGEWLRCSAGPARNNEACIPPPSYPCCQYNLRLKPSIEVAESLCCFVTACLLQHVARHHS